MVKNLCDCATETNLDGSAHFCIMPILLYLIFYGVSRGLPFFLFSLFYLSNSLKAYCTPCFLHSAKPARFSCMIDDTQSA